MIFSWRDLAKTILILAAAFVISSFLLPYSGKTSNAALIFVMAVTIISITTSGYLFGILASIAGVFFINYAFMYPYAKFNFSIEGYPVAIVSMFTVSIAVCTLTSRIKRQKEIVIDRERQAKLLHEVNERLSKEQNEAMLKAEKEKMRGNLLRAISHDLRTPLTAISGAASVIQESGDSLPEEEKNRLLTDIQNDADWLIRMIENLLSITRIGEGPTNLNKQMEPLEEVIGEAIQKIRKRFRNVFIKVDMPEDFLMAPMDPMLISQVLINLLENALRHSGSTENIRISAWKGDGCVFLQVSDSGRGIAEEDLPRLFDGEPVGWAKEKEPSDGFRGSGIGLSVCKSIVKAHDGIITAENNSEGGASFRFSLPL